MTGDQESGLQDQRRGPQDKGVGDWASLLILGPSGLGSWELPTPWPVGALLIGGWGSHLSTDSTRETRRTSGASGTL